MSDMQRGGGARAHREALGRLTPRQLADRVARRAIAHAMRPEDIATGAETTERATDAQLADWLDSTDGWDTPAESGGGPTPDERRALTAEWAAWRTRRAQGGRQ